MNWRQRVLVGTGLALLTGLLALALGQLHFMRGVEWKLYDVRMRQTVDPANAPKNIAIVQIDEDSIREKLSRRFTPAAASLSILALRRPAF